MSYNQMKEFPSGITIAQMKEILKNAPEVDATGKPFILMMSFSDSNSEERIVPVENVLVEQTIRKLTDGTFGNQITVMEGY